MRNIREEKIRKIENNLNHALADLDMATYLLQQAEDGTREDSYIKTAIKLNKTNATLRKTMNSISYAQRFVLGFIQYGEDED